MCWTIFHLRIAFVYPIFHEEVSDIYIPGVSGTRIKSIFLHLHRALIVLIYYYFFYPINLCNHEHHELYIVWDIFAHSYQLGFFGVFHVYLFLQRFSVYYSISHWYCTPCMSSHIIMHSIHYIYPCEQVRECFSPKILLSFIVFLSMWDLSLTFSNCLHCFWLILFSEKTPMFPDQDVPVSLYVKNSRSRCKNFLIVLV